MMNTPLNPNDSASSGGDGMPTYNDAVTMTARILAEEPTVTCIDRFEDIPALLEDGWFDIWLTHGAVLLVDRATKQIRAVLQLVCSEPLASIMKAIDSPLAWDALLHLLKHELRDCLVGRHTVLRALEGYRFGEACRLAGPGSDATRHSAAKELPEAVLLRLPVYETIPQTYGLICSLAPDESTGQIQLELYPGLVRRAFEAARQAVDARLREVLGGLPVRVLWGVPKTTTV